MLWLCEAYKQMCFLTSSDFDSEAEVELTIDIIQERRQSIRVSYAHSN